ncbi:50S ribosomal protein L22 [Candidatus Peregrinibacteria bacterium CG10_big_fil_rev_8_21_14_0_10_49_16]|nr:MAG: 50S ribosomal protein L22 [Candidatus Peregrinibacteria bacterium CG22_combo_CG10-13_8_21_14_all_49_11]PIR51828.1 MAG: 50S ribosomal protein L22 [Candidatus Peregrinibacteria bacterium CG10_big_fil_rev_8_21_14_0_10_49_16]
MKAHLKSVRIAPKKANLVAKIVRGMPVRDAQEVLRITNKKAARILEKLLRSAQANAEHNDKQSASALEIREIVVNEGGAYRRGVPRARGRVRPIRKRLSHITLLLGVREEKSRKKEKDMPKSPSASS